MPETLGARPTLKELIDAFLTRIGSTHAGEEAGSGVPVDPGCRKIHEAAYKADPDGFIDGAARTHWSNPDGPTGGMPPDKK